MNWVSKIINETLKNPHTGQWSRKNLTGFSSFAYTVYYVTYGQMHEKAVQEFVVIAFLSLAATCLGISSWEKLNLKKDEKEA